MSNADWGILTLIGGTVAVLGFLLWGALGIIDRHLHRQHLRDDWEQHHHKRGDCNP